MTCRAYCKSSPLEAFIVDFYQRNRVINPRDIDLGMMAEEAGIWVDSCAMPSTHFEMDDAMYRIVIDERMPLPQQRVELAFELARCMLHVGNDSYIAQQLRKLGDVQAEDFALHALVPSHMLEAYHIYPVYPTLEIAKLALVFTVPENLMTKRLDLLTHHFPGIRTFESSLVAESFSSLGAARLREQVISIPVRRSKSPEILQNNDGINTMSQHIETRIMLTNSL